MKILFNLVPPSQTTTSRIPKSPEVRFLIVWSSINHFLVHSSSPATPHIHSTSGQIQICNPVRSLWWGFFAEVVYMLRSLAVSQGRCIKWGSKCDSDWGSFLYWGYMGESWFSWFTPSKCNKRKSWTESTSSFPRRTTHLLGRQGKKRVTNIRAFAHKSWMVGCSPHALEF